MIEKAGLKNSFYFLIFFLIFKTGYDVTLKYFSQEES